MLILENKIIIDWLNFVEKLFYIYLLIVTRKSLHFFKIIPCLIFSNISKKQSIEIAFFLINHELKIKHFIVEI